MSTTPQLPRTDTVRILDRALDMIRAAIPERGHLSNRAIDPGRQAPPAERLPEQ